MSAWDTVVVRHLVGWTVAMLGGAGAIIGIWRLATPSKPELWRKVKSIYISWLVMFPLLVIPLLLGQLWFTVVVVLLSLRSLREYARAVGLWQDALAMGVVACAVVGMNLVAASNWYGLYQVMPLYGVLLVFLIPIWRDAYHGMIQRVCLSVVGVVYFGWCLSHLSYFMNIFDVTHTHVAAAYILTLVILTELNHVGAFMCGHVVGALRHGRVHKLAPHLSPNKTVEGALGACVLTCGATYLLRWAIPAATGIHILIIGLLVWAGATFGDLVICFIKRDVGIKDMGTVVPGRGGVLDRFDSLIFTTPLFFHYLRYFFGDTLGLS